MNPEDLWVGDLLKIISTGKIGSFEGVGKDGMLKLKDNKEIFWAKSNDVEEVEERETKAVEIEDEPFMESNKTLYFDTTLDLHIEVLKPDLQHARAEQILNYQLRATKFYVEKALFLRKHKVLIIHGKGVGLLKLEIEQILKSIAAVSQTIEKNNGGAVEVYFKY